MSAPTLPVNRMWGLCEGCILRTREEPKALEATHLYRLVAVFFGERLPATSALCLPCWRLLHELRHFTVGLHDYEDPEVDERQVALPLGGER